MPIFMMFGKYSSESLKGISSERTDRAVNLIKKHGGKVISMYAVLGEHDLVFTLDFPDAEKAMATSVELNKLTGISFTTSPVVEVEIHVNLFNSTEVAIAFSVSGKSNVKTRSCSPSTAYMEITFPPCFLIRSTARSVRSELMCFNASDEYLPKNMNIGIAFPPFFLKFVQRTTDYVY